MTDPNTPPDNQQSYSENPTRIFDEFYDEYEEDLLDYLKEREDRGYSDIFEA